jgi:acetyl esterase/lipase
MLVPHEHKPVEVTGLQTPVVVATDIIFGRGGQRDLKLDLYQQADRAESPLPVVVFIHGGGWHGGEKESYREMAAQVASHGYVCASIDYRLAGEAPFPAALEDCKCAVRWVRAHASELQIDPSAIAVLGHSAGGHLAAMVALSPGKFEGDGGWPQASSAAQCALCYSAPYDLAALERSLGTPLTQFLGSVAAAEASPLTYVQAGAVPFLVCHGDADDLVPVEQSDVFVSALQERDIPVDYLRLPGGGHDLSPFNEVILADAVRFLEAHLGPLGQ